MRMIYEVIPEMYKEYFFPPGMIESVKISLFVSPFFYLALTMAVDYLRNRITEKNVHLGNAISRLDDMDEEEYKKSLRLNCLEEQIVMATAERNDLPIQAARISKIFRTTQASFYALKDVSIILKKNETLGLLGPNGAGKSTLFNIISTYYDRTAGEIRMFGNRLDTYSSFFKESGICAQDNILWDNISVGTQLRIMRMMRGIPLNIEKQWLEFLELSRFRGNKPSGLSSGMKRKVCFLISSMSNPTFKFMDEPTTGLDPIARKRFREIVEKQKGVYGGSSVFTTHTMSEAERMCDRIAILINGTFVVVDSVENIKNQTNGFNLTLYKNSPMDLGENLIEFVLKAFPDLTKDRIKMGDENTNRVVFELFNVKDVIGGFESLIGVMKKGGFKDFDLCRKNLDDVILALSRYQEGRKGQ